jgi:biotin-dependent carboxylase-like uncharacterized protein
VGSAERAAGRLVIAEVVEPGPLTSVQDPFGRTGWRHLGVPVGGAADARSARLANRLVGNPEAGALFEVTLGGFAIRTDGAVWVAVTGGLLPSVGSMDLPANEAWLLRPGTILRLEPGDGARGYVALAGGLAVEPVLGSASTDLRTGFGGHGGRSLRAGDRLTVGGGDARPARWIGAAETGPMRIVRGPHPGAFESLVGGWTVGTEADRTGVRLNGPRLPGGEVASMGLPLGAIQVPPDGRPIVMLADRPVTGGYRVPACVIRADIGRVAQLRTGDAVRFVAVSVEDAVEATGASERTLDALEHLDPDDDIGWAGAHG